MRDHTFDVENGTVVKVNRVSRERRTVGDRRVLLSDHWRIQVEPSSETLAAEVTLAVKGCDEEGALCTLEGAALAQAQTLTLGTEEEEVLRVSLAGDASARERARKIDFTVMLSRASQWWVEVDYDTVETGDATEHADYFPARRFEGDRPQVIFEPGETSPDHSGVSGRRRD